MSGSPVITAGQNIKVLEDLIEFNNTHFLSTSYADHLICYPCERAIEPPQRVANYRLRNPFLECSREVPIEEKVRQLLSLARSISKL